MRDLSPPRTVMVLHAIGRGLAVFVAAALLSVTLFFVGLHGCTPAPAHTEAVSHD